IGHVGPEALAGGPIGRLRDGDIVRIEIDRGRLEGRIDFIGCDPDALLEPDVAAALLDTRELHPGIAPHPRLPGDTRLWAALQDAGGASWGGCVYEVDGSSGNLGAGRGAPDARRRATRGNA